MMKGEGCTAPVIPTALTFPAFIDDGIKLTRMTVEFNILSFALPVLGIVLFHVSTDALSLLLWG
jgi:hypothetical protein